MSLLPFWILWKTPRKALMTIKIIGPIKRPHTPKIINPAYILKSIRSGWMPVESPRIIGCKVCLVTKMPTFNIVVIQKTLIEPKKSSTRDHGIRMRPGPKTGITSRTAKTTERIIQYGFLKIKPKNMLLRKKERRLSKSCPFRKPIISLIALAAAL